MCRICSGLHWLPLAFLLAFCSAQIEVTSFGAVEAPTSTESQVNTFTIAVGRGGNTYSPDVVQASVGDIIEFQFFPPNHSVVRAEYGYPCIPYEMTGPKVGFFSGFQAVDAILNDPPSWSVRVNDTYPIFYYCSAPGSCINYGMVGVINPNASVSLAHQRALAENSSFALNPGDDWPAEATSSAPPGYSPTPTETSAPTTPTDLPAATSSAAATTSSSHSGLAPGAIAGIAIGGAAVLLIAGFLLWYCGRSSQNSNQQPKFSEVPPPGYIPPAYGNLNYAQPMSPASKYMSGIPVPATPSPAYPANPYDQAHIPGHMSPFGAVQASSPPPQQYYPQHGRPQMSPHLNPDNSGAFAPPAAAVVAAQRAGEESESGRSSSPVQNGHRVSGIEAFLARQDRMSPNDGSAHAESDDAAMGLLHGQYSSAGSGVRPGPYEMSAGNPGSRRRP